MAHYLRDTLKWSMLTTILLNSVASASAVETARAKGLAWLFQNQRGDGSWGATNSLVVQSTSAALDAFQTAGLLRGNTYNAGIASLANDQPTSTDGKARQIISLGRMGSNVSALAVQLQNGSNSSNSWGTFPGYGTSIADTALATSAMLLANPGYSGFTNAVCAWLPYQNSNGGWSYLGSPGSGSAPASAASTSIIPTAYSIMALQTIWGRGYGTLTCGSTNYATTTVIANGVSYLLSKQNADGGFGDNGSSGALETALAYLAIQQVNATQVALAPAQTYFINSQLSNGSWSNDALQTGLVLQTFENLTSGTLADADKDGIPDVVESILGTNPNVPDDRNLVANANTVGSSLPGNGRGIVGITVPVVIQNAYLNKAYSFALTASNGVAPYTFNVVSGRLPDGLTMSSNGVISGTPIVLGPFSFTYQATDSNSNAGSVSGTLQVILPPPPPPPPLTKPQLAALMAILELLLQ